MCSSILGAAAVAVVADASGFTFASGTALSSGVSASAFASGFLTSSSGDAALSSGFSSVLTTTLPSSSEGLAGSAVGMAGAVFM